MKRRILVVDIGGTFVKLLMSERVEREFPSVPRLGQNNFSRNSGRRREAGDLTLYRLVFQHRYVTGEFFETRNTLAKIGCILVLPGRWESQCASLTMQRCKRSAVISAAGACCFLGSGRDLDRRWCGTEISCRSNWVTSPIRMKKSLKTISVFLALRN